MIAIGRGQLHAPDRTITDEPDRVQEGRLSCAVRPEQDIRGLEGQRNISERAIILDLYRFQASWHDRRVPRKALSYQAPCCSMIPHVERFMNRAVSGVDAPPPLSRLSRSGDRGRVGDVRPWYAGGRVAGSERRKGRGPCAGSDPGPMGTVCCGRPPGRTPIHRGWPPGRRVPWPRLMRSCY